MSPLRTRDRECSGDFGDRAECSWRLQGIARAPHDTHAAAHGARELLDQRALAGARLPADERDLAAARFRFPQLPGELIELGLAFEQFHGARTISDNRRPTAGANYSAGRDITQKTNLGRSTQQIREI